MKVVKEELLGIGFARKMLERMKWNVLLHAEFSKPFLYCVGMGLLEEERVLGRNEYDSEFVLGDHFHIAQKDFGFFQRSRGQRGELSLVKLVFVSRQAFGDEVATHDRGKFSGVMPHLMAKKLKEMRLAGEPPEKLVESRYLNWRAKADTAVYHIREVFAEVLS